MASIFKNTITRQIPADAQQVVKSNKTFVRIVRRGKLVLFPVTECGSRYKEQSKCWYIKYRTEDGRWRRVRGFSDKSATTQLAARLERQRDQVDAGLIDRHDEAMKRSLMLHLDDFKTFLGSKANSPKHIELTFTRLKRILEGCKFHCWKDIAPSKLTHWLAVQRAAGTMGIKTSNYYQAAMKEFCTWLKREGRVANSPLEHLQALNSEPDVRRLRRPLSPESFAKLIDSAYSGPTVQCMSGPDRAMLYIMAAWTGFRRGELASLTGRSFNFEIEPPTVTCSAGYSKRRRKDVIPLHPVVVERLQTWFNSKTEYDAHLPVFALKTANGGLRRTSKMMKEDLERVGIPYCDEDGLYADFHANRHTFVSNLARSGVSPQLAQTIARHSDVNLTLGVYTHIQMGEQAVAIETLSAPPEFKRSPKPNMSACSNYVDQNVDQTIGGACRGKTIVDSGQVKPSGSHDSHKPLPRKNLDAACQRLAGGDRNSGGGIRTPDTRIMILPLAQQNAG